MPPVLIHLHVPKCAGSSINRVLADRFRPHVFALNKDKEARDRYLRMTPDQRDHKYSCVFGHLRYGEHELFNRSCVYISATRDPIDRICSFFNFIHTRPEHPLHGAFKSLLPDLNYIKMSDMSSQVFGPIWVDRFVRVYNGPAKTYGTPSVERVIERVLNRDMLLGGPKTVIEPFLRAIGCDPLPELNLTKIPEKPEGWVPASSANLTYRARMVLEEFCYNDYRLMDRLSSVITVNMGYDFAVLNYRHMVRDG